MAAIYSGMDISLHRHADADRSLFPVLPDYFRRTYPDKKYPFHEWRNHHEEIIKWFGNPLKGDIVKKFSLTTGVLQSSETISLWAENFVNYMAGKAYKYCRVIFAPQYHTLNGLTEEGVIAAWVKGIKKGEKKNPRIKVNAFLGIGREVSTERAVELVDIFAQCPDREYFPGVTLVCDEAKNPPESMPQCSGEQKKSGLEGPAMLRSGFMIRIRKTRIFIETCHCC